MKTFVFKPIVAAALMLSFTCSAFSQQVAKTIPNSTSPDGLIGFLQFTPPDYGSQKHPLIIFLHGIGERGNGTSQVNSVAANGTPFYCSRGASMRFTVNGQTSSFVVLSPQLSAQYGYWPTYYVKEMIKYAKANLQIDPNRIYVTGLSLGGGGVWRFITDATGGDYSLDGTIAAAAPVCGTQEETDADFCKTIGDNHLPVWAFHSMDDGTVSVNATQHAEMLSNMCGITPAPKFTYYQSGNHAGAWINAYDTGHITRTVSTGASFTASPNLYEWFLSNTRGTTFIAQPSVNTPPTVSAGAAQTITAPPGSGSVTLNGSASGTNGATISSYAWTKTSGPASGNMSAALSATTNVTSLAQGSYVFTLTVTDNHGLTSSSAVTITVNATTANTAPTVNAGTAQTITAPSGFGSVTLYGSASGTNGATISSYAWSKTSGPSSGGISAPSSAVTNVTGLAQGSYVYTLTATDNNGLSSSSSVNVTVNATSGNTPPTVNAGNAQTISAPDGSGSVTLYGSASGTNGASISSYSWTKTSGPSSGGMSAASSATTNVTGLVQGAYVFTLTATDNRGLSSSSSVTITVNPVSTTQPSTGNLIGYIKMSVGPYQACDDASSSGRIAVYGTSITNGAILYADAAMTTVYNGGWNWFSFTPTVGAKTTYAFAIYPNGSIGLLRNCVTGASARVAAATTADQDIATLNRMKDSAATAATTLPAVDKLMMYPNPVHTNATIRLNSSEDGPKVIYVYSADGVLRSKYSWQTTKGNNTYQLKDVSNLGNGMYVAEIRTTTGKSLGSLKFMKM